jgi:hypothetical protein
MKAMISYGGDTGVIWAAKLINGTHKIYPDEQLQTLSTITIIVKK